MPNGKFEIQTFTNADFGNLNVIAINDNAWFIGKEVAEVLGYTNPRKAIIDHVDKEDKNTVTIRYGNQRGNPNKVIINESGLYSLILSSKLKSAKKFKRWVTSEVLPSIRKHGAYMTEETIQKALTSPDFLIQLATKLKEEQELNTRLKATNAALVGDINTWDSKAVLNALIRAYASRRSGNNFGLAFGMFYRQVNYKLHINLKSRRTHSGESDKVGLINFITEQEMPQVIKMAVAMCEDANINTGAIINQTNTNCYA